MLNIGIVGSGFAARLHLESYRRIAMPDARVYAICSKDASLQQTAEEFGIPHVYHDMKEMLDDPQITLVDITTPPALHADMITDAMAHGKDVICEKPLTGFFQDAIDQSGERVSCAYMLQEAEKQLERIRMAIKETGKRFFYAENYVYAPSVQKCAEFLRARKSKILLLKGEESHSGSHAAHAPYWRLNGGGALIRQGCHPLSGVLYLKAVEASARGYAIRPVSVTASAFQLTSTLTEQEHRYIAAHPHDVEDYANVTIRFSDGSIASIMASDAVVGGTRNNMEAYTTDGVYQCNIMPNSGMMVYHENADHLDSVYFTEKLGQRTGWQPIFLEENVMRGYHAELEDFLQCIRTDRQPQAGFELARETTRMIYTAYQSAQEGRSIIL